MANQDTLSNAQKIQFKHIIMEGIKGKFIKTLHDDTRKMLKIIELWIKYGFLPMDETFCTVDGTSGEVLSICLLNNISYQRFI